MDSNLQEKSTVSNSFCHGAQVVHSGFDAGGTSVRHQSPRGLQTNDTREASRDPDWPSLVSPDSHVHLTSGHLHTKFKVKGGSYSLKTHKGQGDNLNYSLFCVFSDPGRYDLTLKENFDLHNWVVQYEAQSFPSKFNSKSWNEMTLIQKTLTHRLHTRVWF